jgi:RluA family pseudouridine synthase
MELDIVYEDGDLLVANKPPFVLVHPTMAEHRSTLAHGIAFHLQEQGLRTRVRPVHRIDRDTSGLVLFAKSGFAHQRLDRQLRERTLEREYLALVHGALPEESGVVDLPIGRDKQLHSQLRVVRSGGEPAVTRYGVVERLEGATLVRLAMETGRTHQIRVHMAHLGYPVLGDRQYGRQGLSLIKRQALHASRLAFHHPSSGEPVSCEAPLPEDMAGLRELLRVEPTA